MEYFCEAKPQKRDLKAVQGAKRLMLQRLVNNLMVSKPKELRIFEPATTCTRQKATSLRLLHFHLLARVKKECALLADAYFWKLPARVFHKTCTANILQIC